MIETAQDTLAGGGIFFQFQGWSLQVDSQRQMTNGTIGLQTEVSESIKNGEVAMTHAIVQGGFQILLDAFPVKNMPTLGTNGILGDVVTKPANGCFTLFLTLECLCVCLTLQNQVWVASHLSHTCEPGSPSTSAHVRFKNGRLTR